MIKPPIIAPIPLLDYFCTTGVHVCYATVASESSEYRDFYKKESRKGEIVIMDYSPKVPRVPKEVDLYKDLVEDIGPAVVVLPDTDIKMKKTIDESLDFLEQVKSFSFIRSTIGMLQGRNLEELGDCYTKFKDKVSAIGLPSSLEVLASRNSIVKSLGIIMPCAYVEVYSNVYDERPFMDNVHIMWSSLPLRLAYLGRDLEGIRPSPPPLDFSRKDVPMLAVSNLQKYVKALVQSSLIGDFDV